MPQPLIIDITSDFVCPWCYLGEARLQKALQLAAPAVPVELRWRPYELNPGMPPEGMDRQQYLARKFGADRLKVMDERMKQLGREEGLDFRQELIKRSPNTRRAHRLTWLAAQEGKNVAPLILKAYFTDGQDIGDIAVLTALAVEASLPAQKAKAFLASDEGDSDIALLEKEAMADGVEGVPFFRIGNEEIHGAETAENMAEVLRRVLSRHSAA